MLVFAKVRKNNVDRRPRMLAAGFCRIRSISAIDIDSADNEPNEPNLDNANEEVILEDSIKPTSEVEEKPLGGDSDETLPRRSKRQRKP